MGTYQLLQAREPTQLQGSGGTGVPWQDYHLMAFPEAQYVCMATAASVKFPTMKQQSEEARLNTRGTFIITLQMEKTYQVTGCLPSC